jgi:hypothetical protein
MTLTADLLRTWSERLCTLPSTEARELVRELGIAGSVVSRFGALAIEPSLPGAVEVKAVEHQGRFDRLDLQLAPRPDGPHITRSELEQRFGHGVAVPRGHADSYFTLSYRLDLPGAPFGCDVSAEFAAEPGDDTPVGGISLRRQPAAARPQVAVAELIDVLAKATAKLRQDDGAELKQHVEEVRDQVAHFGQTMQASTGDEQARKAAAAQIEKLLEAVGKTGVAARRAVAKQGETVRQAAQQAISAIDLSALTDALRRFGALLASGTPESQARLKELLAQLEAAVGPSLGKLMTPDPARQQRADQERRAAIKQDVQASLDEIFRGKKKP